MCAGSSEPLLALSHMCASSIVLAITYDKSLRQKKLFRFHCLQGLGCSPKNNLSITSNRLGGESVILPKQSIMNL